jgi:hypothetical protein
MHQSQITTVGNSNRFAALEVHILPSWFTASLGALVHGKGLLSVEKWEGFPNEKCRVRGRIVIAKLGHPRVLQAISTHGSQEPMQTTPIPPKVSYLITKI